jgi:hypothetical protein
LMLNRGPLPLTQCKWVVPSWKTRRKSGKMNINREGKTLVCSTAWGKS